MTREDVLLMAPGPELNAKVAEMIIGHVVVRDEVFGTMERWVHDGESVWDILQPYSEDPTTAETVVEKMLQLGFDDAVYWSDFGQGQYTRPEAICKGALIAMLGGKVDCKNGSIKHDVVEGLK